MAEERKKLVYLIDTDGMNADVTARILQRMGGYDVITETRQTEDHYTADWPKETKIFSSDTILKDILAKKPDVILCPDSLTSDPEVPSGRKIIGALRKQGNNTPAIITYIMNEFAPNGLPSGTESLYTDMPGHTGRLLEKLAQMTRSKDQGRGA